MPVGHHAACIHEQRESRDDDSRVMGLATAEAAKNVATRATVAAEKRILGRKRKERVGWRSSAGCVRRRDGRQGSVGARRGCGWQAYEAAGAGSARRSCDAQPTRLSAGFDGGDDAGERPGIRPRKQRVLTSAQRWVLPAAAA